MADEMRTVPQGSEDGAYLTIVACHGRCVCDEDFCVGEDPTGDVHCIPCSLIDPEWPCPAEPDSGYPDPDLVKIEGAER